MAIKDTSRGMTAERVRFLLDYNPETGEFRWRNTSCRRLKTGDIAGHIRVTGYRQINLDGKLYRAHRLAWLYVYGEWPKVVLDHINNDRSDDRIANLREADRTENYRNMLPHKDGNGFKGICFFKRTGRWMARICVNRHQIHLGYFDTPEDAAAAYDKAAIEHFGEFAKTNADLGLIAA